MSPVELIVPVTERPPDVSLATTVPAIAKSISVLALIGISRAGLQINLLAGIVVELDLATRHAFRAIALIIRRDHYAFGPVALAIYYNCVAPDKW